VGAILEVAGDEGSLALGAARNVMAEDDAEADMSIALALEEVDP
jgi:hypothetical protein